MDICSCYKNLNKSFDYSCNQEMCTTLSLPPLNLVSSATYMPSTGALPLLQCLIVNSQPKALQIVSHVCACIMLNDLDPRDMWTAQIHASTHTTVKPGRQNITCMAPRVGHDKEEDKKCAWKGEEHGCNIHDINDVHLNHIPGLESASSYKERE